MDWDSITIANLHLTMTEHQYYEDIFSYCCENTDSESVPVIKVAELLRSANLPGLVTMKILDICFGTEAPCIATHLGKKQFYGLLKLVAAHQAGLNIRKDLITILLDVIRLPKFTWPTSGDEDDKRSFDSYRAVKGRHHAPESTTESESEAESPRETGGSTDSPTPTNSIIQERNNDIGGETILDSVTGGWQGLSEELRQLLGTEEESSERHSSDEGDSDGDCSGFPPEVWIITDEQRDYYTTQFSQLQLDSDGLLHGHIARTFFQKSGLPFEELSHIWRLADITRDGALSLEEFLVAMHLVVLRRNHVPLPDVLPPPLLNPLLTTAQRTPPNTTSTCEKNKEWTKFVDSPTGTNSSLTIPGLQLVNFDFQKSDVAKDPKILHPVPLRLTPEAAILASGANGNSNSCTTLGDDDLQPAATALLQRPLIKKPSAPPEDGLIVTPKKEPPPPPPPRPYRTHARSSSLDLNKLGKNGQSFLGAPPLIPPRVSPGITSPRKLVGQKSEGEGQKTLSDNQSFVADFSHFSPKSELPENLPSESTTPQSLRFSGVCGAFHIYRKPSPKREGGEEDTPKDEVEESKKLTLQELREKNAELRLVCEELTRELTNALQERINLRAKLLLLT
ncbi:PREDICTED: ralBP1-associated Eps domain-containing protein 1 [Dufourea novaeangliae]|uniref:RalBP1-associated Eps domain-containing protein 2 n=1 Tax=Dufourea novaeangliae TaxID=178035 RepID=A0A154PAS8_DUFNO|nr:PREDICTED: ralBP1-associated Eps domain-containing protein 1 [Dufourea novaeangliae]KZC08917.1 RalBP1-associated Eps domain-containing protein 2 [Dufourea novaeangliae]